MKKIDEQLGLSYDFRHIYEDLYRQIKEPLVINILSGVKGLPNYKEKKAALISALKTAREIDRDMRFADRKQSDDPENQYVAEAFAQLKQLGRAKDMEDNPSDQGEWRDLLGPKYSKMWMMRRESKTLPLEADNSLQVFERSEDCPNSCAGFDYYIGEDYDWENIVVEIEFTILKEGFQLSGRYSEGYYDFGMPWEFRCLAGSLDFETNKRYALTLEAKGDRLSVKGAVGISPEKFDISYPRASKTGGLDLSFDMYAKVIIHKLRIKVLND